MSPLGKRRLLYSRQMQQMHTQPPLPSTQAPASTLFPDETSQSYGHEHSRPATKDCSWKLICGTIHGSLLRKYLGKFIFQAHINAHCENLLRSLDHTVRHPSVPQYKQWHVICIQILGNSMHPSWCQTPCDGSVSLAEKQ